MKGITKAAKVGFMVGALIWLTGVGAFAAASGADFNTRSNVGLFLALMAVVAPGGVIAAGLFSILAGQQLELVWLLGVPLLFIAPSIVNGVLWGIVVHAVVWARVHSRPLFLFLAIGLGAYATVMLAIWAMMFTSRT